MSRSRRPPDHSRGHQCAPWPSLHHQDRACPDRDERVVEPCPSTWQRVALAAWLWQPTVFAEPKLLPPSPPRAPWLHGRPTATVSVKAPPGLRCIIKTGHVPTETSAGGEAHCSHPHVRGGLSGWGDEVRWVREGRRQRRTAGGGGGCDALLGQQRPRQGRAILYPIPRLGLFDQK